MLDFHAVSQRYGGTPPNISGQSRKLGGTTFYVAPGLDIHADQADYGGTPHVDKAAQLEIHAVDRGGTTRDQEQCSNAIFNHMDQVQQCHLQPHV